MQDLIIIHFTVDGEPLTTSETALTAGQILTLAGLSPDDHYLVQLLGSDRISHRGHPEELVQMEEGEVFVSMHFGPVPVS